MVCEKEIWRISGFQDVRIEVIGIQNKNVQRAL
jgi:hypothetical protein